MKKKLTLTPLGKLLIRSEVIPEIDPKRTYKQVTVKLWGKGVVLRDEVPGYDISTTKKYVVRSGQFILSKIDARNGAFGLIPAELNGGLVSGDFPHFNINTDQLDPKYLEWTSKTKGFIELCRAASEGTTNRVRLKENKFIRLEILLPHLSEQQRIVAKIEELAANITKAQKLRTQSIDETSALIHIVGKAIFRHPNRRIEDVAFVTKLAGFEYTKYFTNAGPGDVIVLRAGNVRNSGIFLENAMTIPVTVSDDLPRSQLKSGDVVMTFIGAKIGDVTYIKDNHPRLHCGPNVAKITPKYEINNLYLVKSLQSIIVQDQIKSITKSTAQPSLSMKVIRQIQISVPSLEEQRRIVAYLDGLQAKVDALEKLQAQTTAELNALLPSILDRAFKGEL